MGALSGTLKVALLRALTRVRSKATATSKMEFFVIIVNGWKPLIIITKELHLGCCSSPRSVSADYSKDILR